MEKIILGFLNYLTVGIVFILGIVSLLIPDQKKKLTFLFLMFLATGLVSFLFFAGLTFVMPSISIVGFCIILNLFVQNQEFFSSGNSGSSSFSGSDNPIKKSVIIIKLFVSILFTGGLGFLFFFYNDDFFKNISIVTGFNTATLLGVIENINENYIPLIFILYHCTFYVHYMVYCHPQERK